MSTFVKKNKVPETIVGSAEGSAKRNIIRKGGSPRGGSGRKTGISGQAVDDGSMYVDSSALDQNDPNFDSEEEIGFVNIPKYAALHRDSIARSKITLSSYKKLVEPIITEFFLNEDMNDIASSILVSFTNLFLHGFFCINYADILNSNRKLRLLSTPTSSSSAW
jgi:hypothetical protein